jgi:hypothetical protein
MIDLMTHRRRQVNQARENTPRARPSVQPSGLRYNTFITRSVRPLSPNKMLSFELAATSN